MIFQIKIILIQCENETQNQMLILAAPMSLVLDTTPYNVRERFLRGTHRIDNKDI